LVHLRLGLPSSRFPSGFPTKPCMHFSSAPYVPHVPPITCGNVSVAQLGGQVAAVPVGLGLNLKADFAKCCICKGVGIGVWWGAELC
jgi:hypothetical protein